VRRLNKYRGFYDGKMLPCVDLSAPASAWPEWFGKVDAELMQYTGLKDKNGVDICEGDLIKNIPGRVARVFYCDASSRFDCEFVTDKYCQIKLRDRPNERHRRSGGLNIEDWCDCTEVMGNIHENPELLEAKQ